MIVPDPTLTGRHRRRPGPRCEGLRGRHWHRRACSWAWAGCSATGWWSGPPP
ncbi:hypothetical protein QJS66_20035 [Kocuria rhizophila]|nr:hypothetical protein QJS66_20035 [Kocuria rhizophila]